MEVRWCSLADIQKNVAFVSVLDNSLFCIGICFITQMMTLSKSTPYTTGTVRNSCTYKIARFVAFTTGFPII